MRSICLNFEINKPAMDFSVENNDFVKFNTDLAKDLVNNYYSKINLIIADIISEFGSLVKFSFNISNSTINYYREFAPDFLTELSKLDSRSISFNKCISQLDSFDDSNKFTKELHSQQENISEIFNVKTSSLIYLGDFVTDNTLQNIPSNNIDAIISKTIIDSNNVNNIIRIDENFDIKLLQTDIDFSSLFVDNKVSINKIISFLNQVPDSSQLVNLNLNYTDFVANEFLFDKLRNFPEKVMSNSNFTFNSVSELVKYADISDTDFTSKFPKSIFEILNENDIFKTIRKQFHKLDSTISNYKEIQDTSIWSELNNTDLYSNYENNLYFKSYFKQYLKVYRNTKVATLVNRKIIVLKEQLDNHLEQDFLQNTQHRFTDLETMPKVKLKKLLSMVDAETIFYSIQNQSNTLKDKVLSNIPLKVLSSIEQLMEIDTNEIPYIEIRNARRRVLSKLKKM